MVRIVFDTMTLTVLLKIAKRMTYLFDFWLKNLPWRPHNYDSKQFFSNLFSLKELENLYEFHRPLEIRKFFLIKVLGAGEKKKKILKFFFSKKKTLKKKKGNA